MEISKQDWALYRRKMPVWQENYSFSATKEKIFSESLYHAPKGQKALVFSREGQIFSFTEDKSRRKLISEAVAENQLFFSVACTMNDAACSRAMRWFREKLIPFGSFPLMQRIHLMRESRAENMSGKTR